MYRYIRPATAHKFESNVDKFVRKVRLYNWQRSLRTKCTHPFSVLSCSQIAFFFLLRIHGFAKRLAKNVFEAEKFQYADKFVCIIRRSRRALSKVSLPVSWCSWRHTTPRHYLCGSRATLNTRPGYTSAGSGPS